MATYIGSAFSVLASIGQAGQAAGAIQAAQDQIVNVVSRVRKGVSDFFSSQASAAVVPSEVVESSPEPKINQKPKITPEPEIHQEPESGQRPPKEAPTGSANESAPSSEVSQDRSEDSTDSDSDFDLDLETEVLGPLKTEKELRVGNRSYTVGKILGRGAGKIVYLARSIECSNMAVNCVSCERREEAQQKYEEVVKLRELIGNHKHTLPPSMIKPAFLPEEEQRVYCQLAPLYKGSLEMEHKSWKGKAQAATTGEVDREGVKSVCRDNALRVNDVLFGEEGVLLFLQDRALLHADLHSGNILVNVNSTGRITDMVVADWDSIESTKNSILLTLHRQRSSGDKVIERDLTFDVKAATEEVLDEAPLVSDQGVTTTSIYKQANTMVLSSGTGKEQNQELIRVIFEAYKEAVSRT